MKKKIIIIFILYFLGYITFFNQLKAYSVSTTNAILNENGIDGGIRQQVYKIDSNSIPTGKDWQLKIFNEEIGGQKAYCLDPGKGIDTNYSQVNIGELDDDQKRLWAIIYTADLSGLKIVYQTSGSGPTVDFGTGAKIGTEYTLTNENDIYIIKQLLFWATSAGNGLYFSSGHYIPLSLGRKDSKNRDVLFYDMFDFVMKRAAINTLSLPDKAYEYNVNMSNSSSFIHQLQDRLNAASTTICGMSVDDIRITQYKPNHTGNYQRFVGIYVPGITVEPQPDPDSPVPDQYKVLVYKDGAPYSDTGFQEFSSNKTISSSSYTVDGDVEYTGITVYENQNPSSISTTATSTGTSTTLTYYEDTTTHTNIVVFYYQTKIYTITIRKYLRIGNGGSDTLQRTDTSTSASGNTVSIANSLTTGNTTYDSFFWRETSISTSVSNFDEDGISFTMPRGNVTVDVYYQVGKLYLQYYLHDRVHNLTDIGNADMGQRNGTITLSSSNGIPTSKNVNGTNYYFYKTTVSENPLSQTVGIGRSKYDTTISVYYGLRYYDVRYLTVATVNGNTVYENLPGASQTIQTSLSNWGNPNLNFSWKGNPYYASNTNTGRYEKYNYLGSEKQLNTGFTRSYSSAEGDRARAIDALSDANRRDHLDYTRIAFYYEYEPSVKVVIRHIQRIKKDDGTYGYNELPVNSNEGYYMDGKAHVIANGYSQRKAHVVANNPILSLSEKRVLFSGINANNQDKVEIYEVDKSGILTVERLRTILNDGQYYRCLGYERKSYNEKETPKFLEIGYTKAKEDKNASDNQNLLNTVGSFSKTEKTEYVFIDYYYEIDTYSTTPNTVESKDSIGTTASLDFRTKSSNDHVTALGNDYSKQSGIVYVPANENLKPYITTDLCKAKSVEYNLTTTEDGKGLIHNVQNYDAWAVYTDDNLHSTAGTVKEVGEMTKLDGNKVAGTTNVIGADRNCIYNEIRNLSLTNSREVKSDIAGTFNLISHIKDTLFRENITTSANQIMNQLSDVTKTKTADETFENHEKYNLDGKKYNGYHETSGSVIYAVYDITSTTDASTQPDTRVDCLIHKEKSTPITIYSPIEFKADDITVDNKNYVDHTESQSGTGKFVIQQGTTFNLSVCTTKNGWAPYNSISGTGKYVGKWHVKFNFDVKWNGIDYPAGEILTIDAEHKDEKATTVFRNIEAIGMVGGTTSTLVEQQVKVYATSVNLPDESVYDTNSRLKGNNITSVSSDTRDNARIEAGKINLRSLQSDYHSDPATGMKGSAFYIASRPQISTTIGRIFDFEITDCLDVNFKDVFRDLSKENTVNSSTGTRYYAGTRSLSVVDIAGNGMNSTITSTINLLEDRNSIRYGNTVSILPLGPYKHTSNSYISGVKLGYRFSFDVKTSGFYNYANKQTERIVKVKPSYYYISKDGQKYLEKISLYYKNANGNYVKYEDSDYTIYYKPNDGYRTLAAESYVDDAAANKQGTLTDKLTGLNIASKNGFILSDKTSMSTSSNNFLQAWYGEFKLPNSTIALEIKDGKVDINQPLTDGYIGVKFDITCTDKYKASETQAEKITTISYGQNNKNASPSNNTSQWDYEGYLEFPRSNLGNELQNSIKIPLEKGTWNIDDATYQKIKGTVILYDTDNKASDDYN